MVAIAATVAVVRKRFKLQIWLAHAPHTGVIVGAIGVCGALDQDGRLTRVAFIIT